MVRHLLRQICDAILYLHQRQIIHRDIKLENILLSEDGYSCKVKLADFGLSEQLVDGESTHRSRSGTREYQAPEIVEGRPYGRPSDIWSLGCLMFVVLTAEFPRFSSE